MQKYKQHINFDLESVSETKPSGRHCKWPHYHLIILASSTQMYNNLFRDFRQRRPILK